MFSTQFCTFIHLGELLYFFTLSCLILSVGPKLFIDFIIFLIQFFESIQEFFVCITFCVAVFWWLCWVITLSCSFSGDTFVPLNYSLLPVQIWYSPIFTKNTSKTPVWYSKCEIPIFIKNIILMDGFHYVSCSYLYICVNDLSVLKFPDSCVIPW